MKKSKIIAGFMVVLTFSCYEAEQYKPTEDLTSKILQNVTVSKATIPADGASIATITVELSPDSEPSRSKIKFHTTRGLFQNKHDTTYVRASRIFESGLTKVRSKAELTSTTALDTAVVEVSTGDFKKQIKVIFVKAEAESVKIKLSAINIITGYDKSITITANLVRKNGVCTDLLHCDVKVVDSNNNPVGYFLNYSNETKAGIVENQWTLGNLSYSGTLTAVATYTTTAGPTITSSAIISAN